MQLLEQLNPQQQEACTHMEGPLLVLAGAGSGKTRVVTFRIAHLLEKGVPAEEILALTFTNKAAGEMQQRVRRLAFHSVLACTFHSLCARILRESISLLGYGPHFTIFDQEDSEKLLKEVLVALDMKEGKGQLRRIRAQISHWKNQLRTPDSIPDEEREGRAIFRLYQEKLQFYNAVDFDDLLTLTVRLLRDYPEARTKYQKRWSYILIDEYQDTNAAQALLVKLLAAQHGNVFAVGDPDQSIYSWRGAEIDNILRFAEEFPGARVIALEQNYRSRGTILEAANSLIQHNQGRYPKKLWSNLGPGEKIGLITAWNERAEAERIAELVSSARRRGVKLDQQVILYRTNAQSRALEDAFLRHRIPHQIIGGLSFYDRKEIKDLLAMLRLVLGGSDFVAFFRTVQLPKRGLGETTLRKFEQAAMEAGLHVEEAIEAALQDRLLCKLGPKQKEGARDYLVSLRRARAGLEENLPLHELILLTIETMRLLEALKEDPDSYQERKENVEEMISKAAEWESELTGREALSAFLEELSLRSAIDTKSEDQETLSLMTLHHGKGLEFDYVYLVGMEEELFPHINTIDDPRLIEEERRLCYVGMTRAKERLFLSTASSRFVWGMPKKSSPSRFLDEIPPRYLEEI